MSRKILIALSILGLVTARPHFKKHHSKSANVEMWPSEIDIYNSYWIAEGSFERIVPGYFYNLTEEVTFSQGANHQLIIQNISASPFAPPE